MKKPINLNALPSHLSNYMAACEHSYVDAVPGASVVQQAYYCNHPFAADIGPKLCAVMGGSIAGSGTADCHKIYAGHEAIKRRA